MTGTHDISSNRSHQIQFIWKTLGLKSEQSIGETGDRFGSRSATQPCCLTNSGSHRKADRKLRIFAFLGINVDGPFVLVHDDLVTER
jgi:hypothetical protein